MDKLKIIMEKGTERLKRGFAKMVKGGVIMDVTNAEQARIAEEAGAVAVMALHKVPADIRKAGGVARMAPVEKIQEIMDAVTIPVMAKCRIGHEAEARILEALGVDMIDESEVLTPADPFFHIYKKKFTAPFVCGARNLGEAVRRIWEGAAMIRTKGEAGTGNIIEAVRHVRLVNENIRLIQRMTDEEIYGVAEKFAEPYLRLAFSVKEISGLPKRVLENEPIYEGFTYREIVEDIYKILLEIKKLGRLPVVNFAAGGVATPADAALMMAMGMDGVFVGSGIFKSSNPPKMARAIVEAVNHWDEPDVLAEISREIGEPMRGQAIEELQVRMEERGI
ncbi:pyridoxal 5'-phosphate synthase lyase subunit PdxS [Pyrococcus horikoshii]|uniref:Pyridoxal 5'-phosphate synthase subunit PdxS n=2 Tax=Pyrococcus horikoshii TaxID=53953 RepID=PDXS_PYRHO|nr:pyridoxal 5'-phosphate synthase lyase subunit PdxS [Pyrococcus horikoshii]O59080.1 RecName: Full=Pyridoxal 5'-phosphate synthase subunit PdxS; Short=PLP synthase subunit PdxS; AltName: Full=Pdx1 [Pyrococcus horikoshii OT3]4FIQ_A Chain A, Pyridoxal biosynthesis lyase pdxS [Pyrococcus horikoshii OT3]4FIQ_B Chain B, Pyridoxal biosynthesis lyase pdxS [Pyrococcus horikoshii OT3]4FIQ_C Chain C, Pyridoxal biosynthesis lyase pdxS [Pyrococcus horikoshii OT3]4FIQ_D Chain D, Pyridoxal biosynthesis lya